MYQSRGDIGVGELTRLEPGFRSLVFCVLQRCTTVLIYEISTCDSFEVIRGCELRKLESVSRENSEVVISWVRMFGLWILESVNLRI